MNTIKQKAKTYLPRILWCACYHVYKNVRNESITEKKRGTWHQRGYIHNESFRDMFIKEEIFESPSATCYVLNNIIIKNTMWHFHWTRWHEKEKYAHGVKCAHACARTTIRTKIYTTCYTRARRKHTTHTKNEEKVMSEMSHEKWCILPHVAWHRKNTKT